MVFHAVSDRIWLHFENFLALLFHTFPFPTSGSFLDRVFNGLYTKMKPKEELDPGAGPSLGAPFWLSFPRIDFLMHFGRHLAPCWLHVGRFWHEVGPLLHRFLLLFFLNGCIVDAEL